MNQPAYQHRARRPSAIPDTILALLVVNGLVFAAQMMTIYPALGLSWVDLRFALWPPVEGTLRGWPPAIPEPGFGVWQLVSYGFLHGSLPHIAFNMFALWMFGRDIEALMGPRRFLTYFLVCVAGAGVVQLLVANLQGGFYPTVGASGGVFGILLAYGMAFPNRTIMMIFPPIPMKAKYFVILIGLFELYIGFSGRSPGVANFAHLGGMLFGFAMLQYWKGRRGR
ncbi:MAG: rhomboid family intramembrane serine protease [Pseudomonadota bacterium]